MNALPNDVLIQCLTGSPLSVPAIREFANSYRHFRVISTSFKEKIGYCWKLCLESLWSDWKYDLPCEKFVSQLFTSSQFIVNWIDGKPRITRQALEDIKEKECVPEHPEFYKMLGWSDPFFYTGTFDTYFVWNKTFAVQVNKKDHGSVICYKIDDMSQLGKVEGTVEKPLKSCRNFTAPLIIGNTLCLDTEAGMSVYDMSVSPLSEIHHMELPFDKFDACPTKTHLVFFCKREKSFVLAAMPLEYLTTSPPSFVFSSNLLGYDRSSTLVDIQGRLHLISYGNKCKLCIEFIEITTDVILLHPVEIEPVCLQFGPSKVYAHLDKLFIRGYSHRLIIVDLTTRRVKTHKIDCQTIFHSYFIASSFGVMKVFTNYENIPYVLTLDYT